MGGRVGFIIDDEGITRDGEKIIIIEYDLLDEENPVGDYLEEELEIL